MGRPRVAVIGLGINGITAVKNLAEIGLEVVGFERNDYIGGLWYYTTNPKQTSVLRSTRMNNSKQISCSTDFPHPDDVPDYPSGDRVAQYLRDYADHFKLHDKFVLGRSITLIDQSKDGQAYIVKSKDKAGTEHVDHFDKVIVTNGSYDDPLIPDFEGQDHFSGRILHSQEFKSAADFAGQNVVVIGLSNTGGDTAVDLEKHAAKVYLSHRAGSRLVRAEEGKKPSDHNLSPRITRILQTFAWNYPRIAAWLGTKALNTMMAKSHPEVKIEKSWGLLPGPPLPNATPRFLPAQEGIEDPAATKSELPSGSIEMADGRILPSIHAIILCTGYQTGFSFMSSALDPTSFPAPAWNEDTNAPFLYPRLYQGLLHPTYADSLAFIGPYRSISTSSCANADVSAQAIAQIFAGRHPAPSPATIDAWCDEHYEMNARSVAKWRLAKPLINLTDLSEWLAEAAGGGVRENMRWWSSQAWKFWWNDRQLYRLVMDGIDSPHIWRLFEGREDGRKRWDGARDGILKANGKA